jgi:hypothetical protein
MEQTSLKREIEEFIYLKDENQKLSELIVDMHKWRLEEFKRWRDAGITYTAVRDILSNYEKEEISFGKVVEELRGLCEAALDTRLREILSWSKEKPAEVPEANK